jgi:hypothetical protein
MLLRARVYLVCVSIHFLFDIVKSIVYNSSGGWEGFVTQTGETTMPDRGLEIYYRQSYNSPNRIKHRARRNTYFNSLQAKYGERARTITNDEILDAVKKAKRNKIGAATGIERMICHGRADPSRMSTRQLLMVCQWEAELT